MAQVLQLIGKRVTSGRVYRPILLMLVCAIFAAVLSAPVEAAGEKKRKRRSRRKKAEAAAVENKPRNYRSGRFLLHTDLPKKEAQALLKRLNTMLRLISKYWGAPCRKVIECYVVDDLENWPPNSLDPKGLQHVAGGGGVTLSSALQSGLTSRIVDANAVVYAVAERGVPLHEAVHAYCALTFGRTGPTWYSEGMAEMGNYWRENDPSVQLEPVVLRYLQRAEIRSLNELVNGQQSTGDSWREYAWRWALCHLLANNPNYNKLFRPLGIDLLNGKETSFEQVYGARAKEISFEYRFFIKHLDQGLRADLIAFDWNDKFRESRGSRPLRANVKARQGWQPSRLMVKADTKYQYSTKGTWTLVKDGPDFDTDGRQLLPAAPQPQSAEPGEIGVVAKSTAATVPPLDPRQGPRPGQLVGIVLIDDDNRGYRLSKPFLLGRHGTFTAPASGNLYLRCYDAWNQIADNAGQVHVQLKTEGLGSPLKEPPAETAKPRRTSPSRKKPEASKSKRTRRTKRDD